MRHQTLAFDGCPVWLPRLATPSCCALLPPPCLSFSLSFVINTSPPHPCSGHFADLPPYTPGLLVPSLTFPGPCSENVGLKLTCSPLCQHRHLSHPYSAPSCITTPSPSLRPTTMTLRRSNLLHLLDAWSNAADASPFLAAHPSPVPPLPNLHDSSDYSLLSTRPFPPAIIRASAYRDTRTLTDCTSRRTRQ